MNGRRHPSFSGLIGVARCDITPPVGIRSKNWGAAIHEVAEGVHQPLSATVLTLQDQPGGSPLVLVSLDLGWWQSAHEERQLRNRLASHLRVSDPAILVCLTHTHAGPSLCMDDGALTGGDLVAPYFSELQEKVCGAAEGALKSAQPALLDWAYGTCDLAWNRDERRGDRYACGFEPSADVDRTHLLGRITSSEGRLLATVLNYACHPTTLGAENRLLSPDYVGSARSVVEAETDALCLFVQGASGDLAPRLQYTGDTGIAERNGRCLGHAALSTFYSMLPAGTRLEAAETVESGAPLGMQQLVPDQPDTSLTADSVLIEAPLKADLKSLDEIESLLATVTTPFERERLRREKRVRRSVGEGDILRLPIPVWTVGDATIVGIPGEAYSALQVQLRSISQERAVVVANVANGWFGYFPPKHLYQESIYAVWQTPFAEGSCELLETALVAKVSDRSE